MRKLKIAALYIRVSTDRQEELSPDAQKRLLKEYAKNNGFIVSEEFIFLENGISGKKAGKRPQFQKMIGLAKSKEHPFDIILVWKYSRFARNQEESIVYKSLLKKSGIDVISISEPLIDGPFGSLIERIIEWMDEYYSIRLAGEVIRGMTEKALRGGYQSAPPLGYASSHPGEPPVILPEEAEIVKMIFNKYVHEGITMFQITTQLNTLGIKTKQGNLFQRRTIEYILQNPMYIGYIRWNRQHNSSHTIKSEDDWILVRGTHEPIISEEDFNKAQERIKQEHRTLKSRPVTEYRHWLSGLVKCAYCGKSLVASNARNPAIYYFQCSNYSKGKCVSNLISSRKLVPEIIKAFQKIIESGDIEYSVKDDDNKINTSLLEQQLSKLEIKEQRIKAAYINGIDNLDEYKRSKQLITDERNSTVKQLKKLKGNSVKNHKPEMLKRIRKVYNIVSDDSIDMLVKNQAIRSVVEKITYNKKEELIDIYFYYQ